jgi:peptidyl-prolyl cis-trans isomerase D
MFSFGVTDVFDPSEEDYVAKVGDVKISHQDFNRRHQQVQSYYQEQFGEQFEMISAQLNLRQNVLEGMIDNVLLENFAASLGLVMGNDAVLTDIQTHPYFAGARLTRESFRQYARLYGLSTAQFEIIRKQELLQEQLRAILGDLNPFTDIELKSIFNEEESQYAFRYIEFDSKNFENQASVDEENLKTFYESRKDFYKTPKAVNYSFVNSMQIDL